MENSDQKEKNPIIIERGDGLGWTLNFYNKWSYVVLILFLIAVGVAIWLINVWIGNHQN
jgi:uncharacterized membrane protein